MVGGTTREVQYMGGGGGRPDPRRKGLQCMEREIRYGEFNYRGGGGGGGTDIYVDDGGKEGGREGG